MDDQDSSDIRNPFPSPPSIYANYATHNLLLHALLLARQQDPLPLDETEAVRIQQVLLKDQTEIPDWPLTKLEKPRVDWVLENGSYLAFGEEWVLPMRHPSLKEFGTTQLYDSESDADRRPALLSLLRSVLHTYHSFLGALPSAPPSEAHQPGEWQHLTEWMKVLTANMIFAVNDLRPLQARVTLEMMMRRQLELRREETKAIHEKCDSLEKTLAELRERAKDPPSDAGRVAEDKEMALNHAEMSTTAKMHLTQPDDLLDWTSEVLL